MITFHQNNSFQTVQDVLEALFEGRRRLTVFVEPGGEALEACSSSVGVLALTMGF